MPKEESKKELFRERWDGQKERIEKICESARSGKDWTVHLEGLPYIEEIIESRIIQ